VYDKYKKLQDEQIAAATEKLRQEFAAHDEHKHSRTSHIISGQQSTKLRPTKAKPGWNAPREKKTFIRKTRDQVRIEASRFHLRTPTGKLVVPPGQINKKVVENRLYEARIASLPSASHAPTIRPGAKTASELDREKMEERLRRIKNPTESNSGIPAKVITFSDDEDDAEPSGRSAGSKTKNDDLFGDLESDDLFDDLKPKKTATYAAS
jgi:elongin-A